MFRRSLAIAVCTALLTLGGGTAAFAQGGSGADGNGQGSNQAADYTPHVTVHPTLAGSIAVAECIMDAAWIRYDVVMTDPDGVATSHEVKLVLTDTTHTLVVDLGPLVHNRLEGRILWPGATTDHAGHGVTWPGWELVNGVQTPTGGNFGWTRGHITATLQVNPELVVPLSYPPATASCAQPASVPASPHGILAVTGSNVPVIPIAIGAVVVLVAGAGLLVVRRARRS